MAWEHCGREWKRKGKSARPNLGRPDALLPCRHEIRNEGDSFVCAFHDAEDAVQFCLEVRVVGSLLQVPVRMPCPERSASMVKEPMHESLHWCCNGLSVTPLLPALATGARPPVPAALAAKAAAAPIGQRGDHRRPDRLS